MNNKGFSINRFIILVILIFALLFVVVWYVEARDPRFNPNEFHLTASEAAYLNDVYPQPIPREVFAATTANNHWRDILNADRKVVFIVAAENQPYLSRFKYEVINMLQDVGMRRIYSREIVRDVPIKGKDCNGKPCAQTFLMRTCDNNFCVINPARREIIIDNSRSSRVAAAILHKYKNW